ncbi:MAG: polysaccharide deacetylase family protein [Bacteroidia bacterium]|nr:polysaccharide deacetylase family protein [Bacteroidia bacterium]
MNPDPILIYTPALTPRLKYIFHFIFRDVLSMPIRFTTESHEFVLFTGPKFSYAPQPLGDELFFQSRNILTENGINEQNITVTEWEGLKIFFSTGKASALPFDPFAASFYLVSRYEEYLPYLRDLYDRFETKESLAFQNGFIRQPVVDRYAGKIRDTLTARFPTLHFPDRKYSYISTIDIDNAFAYKEKGTIRILGGFAKALWQLQFGEIGERIKVFLGIRRDPYDTYDLQLELQRTFGMECIYFFLLADYGVNDKNVPVQSRKLQSLIKQLADHARVGIHPSFAASSDKQKLKTEVSRLAAILNTEVTLSRQHFLRLNFPQTYRNLLEMDILEDHTMGFAHEIGFRAGTCTAFNFYDLDLEIETRLRIHPFAVMDATLKYYMKVPPEKAMDHIREVVHEIKKVNGTFISLWHNESLSENKIWAGWRQVYEQMVKEASV